MYLHLVSAARFFCLMCRIYNKYSSLEEENYLLLVCSKTATNSGKSLSAIHGNLQDINFVGKAWKFYSDISFAVSSLQEIYSHH